jgi:hypothetical protein
LQLVGRVAEAFRKHIGAPNTFKDHDGTTKHHVVLCSATDAGHGQVSLKETTNRFEVVTRWDDGFFHFGVGVYVEVNANTWPKQLFVVPIYFIIEENMCIMHITNRPEGEFRFLVDNLDSCGAMYDFMASILSDIFKTKPWDFAEARRASVLCRLNKEAKARDRDSSPCATAVGTHDKTAGKSAAEAIVHIFRAMRASSARRGESLAKIGRNHFAP